MSVVRMTDVDLSGKRVLIREDLNVPVADGKVTSDARIRAALPTIQAALEAGAAVMVMSHLGRPTEGQPEDRFSLQPVADHMSGLLGRNVPLVKDWINGVDVAPGDLVLLENVRFLPGEKACDESLARQMAALCDIYVMDAFGTAHRAQASTYGAAEFAPVACAGPLLSGELEALDKALTDPARPFVAIVGGSKVSTKLTVLDALAGLVDTLIVGGGYHGKSTLLRALERGVYDHIPGDGRERVVTVADAVKIRAEDGRSVRSVDISAFLGELPSGAQAREFTTEKASGSTSQAAAVVEALEMDARLLLIDEDRSAPRFGTGPLTPDT